MTEIGKINIIHFNNGAHFLFVKRILDRAEADTAVKDKCTAQVAALRAAYEEEDTALKISDKSLITDKIAKADVERDCIYTGLRRVLDGLRIMPMEETAEAAGVLWQCMKDYAINVKMQMERENGLIMNLVGDMEKKYKAEVETLSLGTYVKALKEANDKVEALILQRNEANITAIVGRMRQARDASDKAYQALAKMVNAQALVSGSGEFDNFINYVNVEILRFKREVLGQKGTAATPAPGGSDGSGTDEPGTETPGGGTGGTENPGSGSGGDDNPGGSDFD